MGFFGGPADGATLAAFSEKTSEAMDKVTERHPAPTYCKPGDVIQRDWLPGVRVYVLGPPDDPAMLKKMEGRVGTEIYDLTGADGTFAPALEAMLAASGDQSADPNAGRTLPRPCPSTPLCSGTTRASSATQPHFGQLYKAYLAKDASWRRIDQDWLLSMARLGLQLDSATNNTSLVLAFEFSDTGEVLLFAADAQIGSWKSWCLWSGS